MSYIVNFSFLSNIIIYVKKGIISISRTHWSIIGIYISVKRSNWNIKITFVNVKRSYKCFRMWQY